MSYTVTNTQTNKATQIDDAALVARILGIGEDELEWALDECGECETGEYRVVRSDAPQAAFWSVVEVDTQGGAYTDSTGVWDVAYPTADAAKRAAEAEYTQRNDEDCDEGETNGPVEFDWHEDCDGRWIGWSDDFLAYVFVTRTTLA